MSIGDIAGLIAAIAFLLLVAASALPLIKLGRTFDAAARSIDQLTEHTAVILEETATSVAGANAQLQKVDAITTSVAQITENASALAGLYAATLGRPLVKVASFSYATRQAFAAGRDKARRPK